MVLMRLFVKFSLVVFCFLSFSGNSYAEYRRFLIDLEGAKVWNSSNTVAIPGDTGTRFSLTDTLDVRSKLVFRLNLAYRIAQNHTISFLYAPLTLKAYGTLPSNILFNGDNFATGDDVNASYKFNSYRLTYAYTWVDNVKVRFKVGFTAKIRDAKIAIADANKVSTKTNVGFVPLVHLDFLWRVTEKFHFQTVLDAMAAPQGRAEDWFLGFLYQFTPMFSAKLGYRMVEGGANVKQVYNFAWLHYLSTGIILEF
jgi:hypothetical protein